MKIKTKKAELTGHEAATLSLAADIIERELSAGREVHIPGFGRFELRSRLIAVDHPMDRFWSGNLSHVITMAHFRPMPPLKAAVKNRKPGCKKYGGKVGLCFHPDGDGHKGSCLDNKGR